MTAQEYLSQLGNITVAINQDIHRLEEMRVRVTSGGGAIRYDKDRVQSSPEDTMSAAVISIVDMDARISQTLARYVEARETIISQIRGLHCELYTRILYNVYVRGMTLKDTSLHIHRSYNNVIIKHKAALQLFEETYGPLEYLI